MRSHIEKYKCILEMTFFFKREDQILSEVKFVRPQYFPFYTDNFKSKQKGFKFFILLITCDLFLVPKRSYYFKMARDICKKERRPRFKERDWNTTCPHRLETIWSQGNKITGFSTHFHSLQEQSLNASTQTKGTYCRGDSSSWEYERLDQPKSTFIKDLP